MLYLDANIKEKIFKREENISVAQLVWLSWLANARLAIVCPFLERSRNREKDKIRTFERAIRGCVPNGETNK